MDLLSLRFSWGANEPSRMLTDQLINKPRSAPAKPSNSDPKPHIFAQFIHLECVEKAFAKRKPKWLSACAASITPARLLRKIVLIEIEKRNAWMKKVDYVAAFSTISRLHKKVRLSQQNCWCSRVHFDSHICNIFFFFKSENILQSLVASLQLKENLLLFCFLHECVALWAHFRHQHRMIHSSGRIFFCFNRNYFPRAIALSAEKNSRKTSMKERRENLKSLSECRVAGNTKLDHWRTRKKNLKTYF